MFCSTPPKYPHFSFTKRILTNRLLVDAGKASRNTVPAKLFARLSLSRIAQLPQSFRICNQAPHHAGKRIQVAGGKQPAVLAIPGKRRHAPHPPSPHRHPPPPTL